MKSYKIAVLPGDGTGPEVVAEGVKVLKTAADKFGFKLGFTEFDFGYMRGDFSCYKFIATAG